MGIGKVTVVNKHQVQNHVYIGRGSVLGNPFVMKDKSDAERKRVIDAYAQHFKKELLNNAKFRDTIIQLIVRVRSGVDINLGCFCAPKACHGDVIKKFIDYVVTHNEIIKFKDNG